MPVIVSVVAESDVYRLVSVFCETNIDGRIGWCRRKLFLGILLDAAQIGAEFVEVDAQLVLTGPIRAWL